MVDVTITEAGFAPSLQAIVAGALAGELARQVGGSVSADGESIGVVGTVDLQALAHAAIYALSTTYR